MGWAKYYEDNVRIVEERKSITDFTVDPIIPIKRFTCPFCNDKFATNELLRTHIFEHAGCHAFFVINGRILSQDVAIPSLFDLKFMNYGSEIVKGRIVINNELEIAVITLNERTRMADLISVCKKYIIKTITFFVDSNLNHESYKVRLKIDILSANKGDIATNKYHSEFFFDEVSEGTFRLPEYKVFLTILAHEKNHSDADMLVEKILPYILSISTDEEDVLDFLLYYQLFNSKTCVNVIHDICSPKSALAYQQVLSLLNYDIDISQKLDESIGKKQGQFQIGCALLQAYLTNNKVEIHYYESKYNGKGLLRDILEIIHYIISSDYSDFLSKAEPTISALGPLINVPLINDLFNIIMSFSEKEKLNETSYNHFSRLSPLVCFIKSEQSQSDDIRNKILKSAVKRFDECEWFFDYASAYFEDSWSKSRITQNLPNIYWKQVESMNQQLDTPYSNNYLQYLRHVDSIQVTPLGDPGCIGCSCFVISVSGFNIMLDCGLRPGIKDDSAYPNFELWKKDIDAIVISHAHIDHSGALSRAHILWPNAMIIATVETKSLLEPLLHDMSMDSLAQSELLLLPIEKSVAYDTFKSIVTVEYSKWINISNNCRIKLHNAGHLIGAAMVELSIVDSEILYTGDYCLHGQELCSGALLYDLPKKPDLLICESTYLHDSFEKNWLMQKEKLNNAIIEALNNKKTILLPSTAYGRSQELLCIIAELYQKELIKNNVDIYIGGFACKACAAIEPLLNTQYKEFFDKCIPLVPEMVPNKNSIIIASSGSMRKNSMSYKVAEEIRKRSRNELVILSAGGQEEDSWNSQNQSEYGQFYPLSVHASRQDIVDLLVQVEPRCTIMTHWGIKDVTKQQEAVDELNRKLNGEGQVMLLTDNNTKSTTEILNTMKRSIYNE